MKLLIPDIKVTERGLETHVFTTQTDGERAITVNIEDLLGFNEYDPVNSFIILVSLSICKP